ncbi:peptidyl-prolyl cis-trans isomerase [Adhaeribacter aerolatus]|uniref:Peptidyl-prolyl cis-trans isomerase n=1 Tax=Adhaeribacter aerolatus TaxID=670289 RepID=A0A512B030_9BACT|nr:FKBP-type peptidyl-prolyl cis-trans isomerase [Adhaeribacter aerolatus]GEO05325.1 peptidyl-prolyl cis-trans isomerase [Adhaeribacter aerolatus]
MAKWIGNIFFCLWLALSAAYAQTDTTVTASGIKYVILQQGTGAKPTKNAQVRVNFTGKFKDGHIFDTSALDKKPLKVRLGRGEIIPAWEEILSLMQTGTKLIMVVPAQLGYGDKGLLSDEDGYTVPPGSDLIFEIELVDIKK